MSTPPLVVKVRRLVLDPALAGQRDSIVAQVEHALALQRGVAPPEPAPAPGPVGRAVARAISDRIPHSSEGR